MNNHKKILSKSERIELLNCHKNEDMSKYADRIKVILWLDMGLSFKQISELLFLNDQTIRNYLELYNAHGVPGLVSDNYKAYTGKLTRDQKEELTEHLKSNIYIDVNPIISYIELSFGVKYSTSGMCSLLHSLGFVHKKTSLKPGKADKEKQEKFIKAFMEMMQNKSENVPVLFIDASHPQHNSMPAYGWIYKGERAEISSNTGRERLNIHGAVNAETHEVIVIESTTVNADSTIELFKKIETHYKFAPYINVFSDNAKYYYCEKVKSYLESSRIEFYNIPSYSPNLNIIERLWKFFHKVVLYNKYYESFVEFRNACLMFFDSIPDYKEKLKTLLVLNFQKFSEKAINALAFR